MPELHEPIERINEFLQRQYGVHDDGRPRFRVVWSEDQYEKRKLTHSREGFELLTPIVDTVKKYQHIKERYVLEQLSVVPENAETDLVEKLSYEPLWTFMDRHENYLPPRADACKMIIDTMLEAMGAGHARILKDEDSEEKKLKELQKVEEYLFGNESKVTDALGLGLGVVVPEIPTSKLVN